MSAGRERQAHNNRGNARRGTLRDISRGRGGRRWKGCHHQWPGRWVRRVEGWRGVRGLGAANKGRAYAVADSWRVAAVGVGRRGAIRKREAAQARRWHRRAGLGRASRWEGRRAEWRWRQRRRSRRRRGEQVMLTRVTVTRCVGPRGCRRERQRTGSGRAGKPPPIACHAGSAGDAAPFAVHSLDATTGSLV